MLLQVGLDLRRPGTLDQVDRDRGGRPILEGETQHDRQHRREPVDPEDPRRLPVKVAEADQVELKERRRSQHNCVSCPVVQFDPLSVVGRSTPSSRSGLFGPGGAGAGLRSSSSSRRWRPVSETKTSSRLTCRVVRRASGRSRRRARRARRGSRDAARRRSESSRRSRPGPRGPSRARGMIPRPSVGRRPRFERELDDVVATQPGDQLGGRALGDDLALVDDRDPVAEPLGLVHVVGRQARPCGRGRAGRESRPRAGGGIAGPARSSARPGTGSRGRRPRPSRRPAAAAGRRRAAR